MDDRYALVWLLGASRVNAGVGPFSQIIREYNRVQGQLRGETFTDTQLQTASNRVGLYLVQTITDPVGGYILPSVKTIGEEDLNGVRDVLYPDGAAVGAEMGLNQAWPGIVMLGAEGQNFAARLLQRVDTDAEVLDTVQDS